MGGRIRRAQRAQTIGAFDMALWDLKAKRANLPLAKLFGAHRDAIQCYNTSGSSLHTPLEQLLENTTLSRKKGNGGIKLKLANRTASSICMA